MDGVVAGAATGGPTPEVICGLGGAGGAGGIGVVDQSGMPNFLRPISALVTLIFVKSSVCGISVLADDLPCCTVADYRHEFILRG